ncbi:MAG: integral rane sensor signal transduction histidine kinase [Paenibacillus sp.]|nr:integral rane sensor signal transduction histidine kinase [Paenibacillus sp.]
MTAMLRTLFRIGKPIAGYIERKSLQSQLIAAYILLILIPIIVYSAYVFDGLHERSINETIKSNQFVLESEMLTVQGHIDVMERTVQMSISDKEVLDYLVNRKERSSQELVDFQFDSLSKLQMLLFSNPKVTNIRLYTDNPFALEIWPIIFRESRVTDRIWHRAAMERQGTVYWDILKDEGDILRRSTAESELAKDYVSVFREIVYPKGTHAGVIQVDMRIDQFFPKAFGSMEGAASQLYVLDREGRLHTNDQTPYYASLATGTIAQAFPIGETSGKGSFEFVQDGARYVGLYAKIEPLGAYLMNVVSLEETISGIQKTRTNIVIITAILLVLLSVITYFLQSLILKRLHRLRDSIKKVRGGDLAVAIDIRGNNDVAELAYHFREMVGTINGLIAEAVNKEAASKEAELHTLKNQIDAHFLFNTLENIKMLAEIDGQFVVSDALTSLGGMMRYSLKWTSDRVQLRDELGHLANYVAIMNIRYDNRIRLVVDVPGPYPEQEVLKMSLQPIVENAVKYGLGHSGDRETELIIELRAYVQDEDLWIVIADNGAGIPLEKLAELEETMALDDEAYEKRRAKERASGGGIGLRNVNRRMAMFYGRSYAIRIDSEEGRFTKVYMKVPYKTIIRSEP